MDRIDEINAELSDVKSRALELTGEKHRLMVDKFTTERKEMVGKFYKRIFSDDEGDIVDFVKVLGISRGRLVVVSIEVRDVIRGNYCIGGAELKEGYIDATVRRHEYNPDDTEYTLVAGKRVLALSYGLGDYVETTRAEWDEYVSSCMATVGIV